MGEGILNERQVEDAIILYRDGFVRHRHPMEFFEGVPHSRVLIHNVLAQEGAIRVSIDGEPLKLLKQEM